MSKESVFMSFNLKNALQAFKLRPHVKASKLNDQIAKIVKIFMIWNEKCVLLIE